MPFFSKKARSGMRRSTLVSMLNMDQARLSDLGLSRHDIVEAMRHNGNVAGQILDARRNERAANWLR
jgi:hypothetical protein